MIINDLRNYLLNSPKERDVLSIKVYFSHHETPVEKGKMNQRGNHKENYKAFRSKYYNENTTHKNVCYIPKAVHRKGIYSL